MKFSSGKAGMERYFKKLWNWISHPVRELHKYREMRRLRVNDQTELIIEGFPRSANTFAVVAFEQSQNREVRIAHHHHCVDQVIEGVKRHIPVCVLIRDPVDATKSAVLRDPGDINDRLERYIEFYSKAWPLREDFIVAPFNQVTSDFGKIIKKINKKYRTDFSVFEHTEENCRRVFNELAELNRRNENGDYERSSAPDNRRIGILENMDVVLDQSLLDHATDLYNQFMEVANT